MQRLAFIMISMESRLGHANKMMFLWDSIGKNHQYHQWLSMKTSINYSPNIMISLGCLPKVIINWMLVSFTMIIFSLSGLLYTSLKDLRCFNWERWSAMFIQHPIVEAKKIADVFTLIKTSAIFDLKVQRPPML